MQFIDIHILLITKTVVMILEMNPDSVWLI